MKLLLLYAFPEEIKELLAAVGRAEEVHRLPFRAFRAFHPKHQLLVAETGLGIESARRVFCRMSEPDAPDGVISLGYCGALSPDASVGDLVWASEVCLVERQEIHVLSLPDCRETFDKLGLSLPVRAATFLTMKGWMKKSEVARFVTPEMKLPVCDMETFALAQLSSRRDIPFHGIRAVSDGVDRELAFDPRDVCNGDGFYSAARALRLLLIRPRLIPHMIEMRRDSRIASRNLARAVRALVELL